ncbi:hypothetical protein [Qipengyuania flava]|uniref:hypothetical protein n=1 Tax=Qipengyuania flava TaxID=192812 RepID=UPI001C634520|nr:hypothetical protein [Qipengyuania flava]QYJ06615.1 hypothetical protein KUV82_11150 [Qipengyuania flava]
MDQASSPRLHVLGHPLAQTSLTLVTSDGEDLASALDGREASIAFDRAGTALSANVWPALTVREDGLFTSEVGGRWVPPHASLSIGEAAPSLGHALLHGIAKEDVLSVSARNAQVVSLGLGGTRYSEPGQSFYLAGSQVEIAYSQLDEGLELRLQAPLEASRRVHKGAIELEAQLSARFLLPANALPYAGLWARRPDNSAVVDANWQPSQRTIGDLAARYRGVVARGSLDWGGDRRGSHPTGPWVDCLIEPHRMHLVPRSRLSRKASGAFEKSRTEGELELHFGMATLEKALEGRSHARLEWFGPAIGYVNGVTTRPMEQGGPRFQALERLALDLTLNADGVQVSGKGKVGPGGDLGPEVTMDFLIPALWLKVAGARLG